MAEAVRRNVALVLGLALTGMICALAAPAMRFSTGAPGPSVLQSESPILGWLAILGCLAVALVVACLVGRLINALVGLFVLGGGLFILANRSGTLVNLAMGDGSQGLLVIECLIWAALILGLTLAVFRFAGPLRDIEPDVSGNRPHWFASREALVSAGAGVLVLPVVWAVAQSPMKGQTLAAVILGSMAAGLAGRLLSPHVQPKLLFASVCVFGAVGHVMGIIMLSNDLAVAVVTSEVPVFSLPMPVDYAAGALLGVSMGMGWAKSFLHHEDDGS